MRFGRTTTEMPRTDGEAAPPYIRTEPVSAWLWCQRLRLALFLLVALMENTFQFCLVLRERFVTQR